MPCYDPETHDRPVRMEKKLHQLTALLCYACAKLEESAPWDIKTNEDLLAWWTKHKEHDAQIAAVRQKYEAHGYNALSQTEQRILDRDNDISY